MNIWGSVMIDTKWIIPPIPPFITPDGDDDE